MEGFMTSAPSPWGSLPAFFLGIAVLIFGGHLLVHFTSQLSKRWGVKPLFLSIVLLGMGTSAPEWFVTVTASFRGSSDMALGNVVGSNITNILLILGVSGLFYRHRSLPQVTHFDLPALLIVTALLWAFSLNGQISSLESFFLLILFVFYLTLLLRIGTADRGGDARNGWFYLDLLLRKKKADHSKDMRNGWFDQTVFLRKRKEDRVGDVRNGWFYLTSFLRKEKREKSPRSDFQEGIISKDGHSGGNKKSLSSFFSSLPPPSDSGSGNKKFISSLFLPFGGLILGFCGLFGGSVLTVESGSALGEFFGFSEKFIGVFMLSVGTSLPELAVSVQAVLKKQGDMALGNVVGSNMFNSLFVLGSAGAVQSINLSPGFLRIDYPLMFAVSFLLFISLLIWKSPPRIFFAGFLPFYALYILHTASFF